MDNENIKLSRNRKKRIERRYKSGNDMKFLINKIKSEEKKKYKNLDKIKQLEIILVNIKYANDHKKIRKCSKRVE